MEEYDALYATLTTESDIAKRAEIGRALNDMAI
jgi:hypothetical protein